MERSRGKRIGNIVALLIVLFFNYLANALPLGGQTTGEISNRYFSMFTPAGFTFAIWGVIYLFLCGFIIRQLIYKTANSDTLSKVRLPFLLNCLANSAWLLMWHYDQLALSMLFMVVLFATLYRINQILANDVSLDSISEQLFIVLPFSIYFGWISVATIANISVLQSAYGLNDSLLSQQVWTVLKLLVAACAAYFWGWKPARPAYLFVISWAAFGISIANANQSLVDTASGMLAVVACLAGIIILMRNFPPVTRFIRTRTDASVTF